MDTEAQLINSIDCGVVKKSMKIGNYDINYIEAGAGEPVLLIHGANIGWGQWYRNIAEIAKKFKVIALDLPGAGRSTKVDYSKIDPNKDLLQVVKEFIAKLSLKNLNLVGSSMGGWIAMRLILDSPDNYNKLILVNSGGFTKHVFFKDRLIGFYPFAKLITKLFIRQENRTHVDKFLRGIFYHKNLDLGPFFFDYFFETMQTSHNLLFISMLTKHTKFIELNSQLANLGNKTLIIWGKEDKIMPLEKNKENFQWLKNARVDILPDVGHMPCIESAQDFNRRVVEFLA